MLLESLSNYHYPAFTNYEIAKGIVEIYLRKTQNLQSFIEQYENVTKVDWKDEFSTDAIWTKVLNLSLEFIQKEKDWDLAVKILTFLLNNRFYWIKRGFWWERLILITSFHLNFKDLASVLIKLAVCDPFVRTGKRIKLENLADKAQGACFKSTNNKFFDFSHDLYTEVLTNAKSCSQRGKLMFSYENSFVNVEEYALLQYKLQGWEGFHSENEILTSIYGILCTFWKNMKNIIEK